MALAHFQRTFTDASGNVKPGLSVTVRRESDNGLAALFADAGSVTPKSNPFNTDANGHGSFYVVDGRYRIQATDIDWRNEDLISQPSPNFTVMPQVGGDPIVESGGNSDGEWTRWADGLLINRVKIIAVVATANTQASVTWTYPAPLITILHAVPHGFIANHSSTVTYTMLQPLFANSVGTSSTLFYMKADTTQEYRYALQIIGRWK